MGAHPEPSGELFEVLNGYLADLEAGRAVSKEDLLEAHPRLRERLEACLESLRFLSQGGADVQPPREGGVLGDYRIERELGRGGMGVVFEAEQVSLGRRVALKTLPYMAALDERQLQRFRNEALATAQLEHDHIVPVHGVGCDQGVHYYAMQYIPGLTLADVIECFRRGERPVPARDLLPSRRQSIQSAAYCRACARLGLQAARALAYAHRRGVVHRDVKPANLLLDEGGEVWITDFGLATFRHNEAALTMTGDVIGTGRYMSPEQWLAGRAPVDGRTDVYSLGVTLYELLTLERAFPGEDAHRLAVTIATQDPVPIRRYNPACPTDLATIVTKAMSKDPDERYPTALALAEDLERFLVDRPILARPPSLLGHARKWRRRNRALVRAGAVVLLVAGLAAALLVREHARAAQEQSATQLARTLFLDADGLRAAAFEELKVGRDENAQAMFQKAIEELEHVLDLQPEYPNARWRLASAHAGLSHTLDRTGNLQAALRERRKYKALQAEFAPSDLVRRNPADREAARLLWELGRLGEAEDAYVEVCDQLEAMRKAGADMHWAWPGVVMANYDLGLLLLGQGRTEQARRRFELAVRPLTNDPRYQVMRAWVLAECPDDAVHDPRRALEVAREACTHPELTDLDWRARSLLALGAAHYRLGRYREAVGDLEGCVRLLYGGTGCAWYLLAMAHECLEEREEALTWFHRREQMNEMRCWTGCRAEIRRLRREAAELLGE